MGVGESGPGSILVSGCDLLSAPGDLRTNVDLRISGNRITSIEPSSGETTGADRVIDGTGLLAIPGLVNAHSHSPENCLRGIGEGLKLEPWLLNMFGASGLFDPESNYLNAMAGAVEMLKLGVTSVVDHLWMTPPSIDSIGAAIRAYDEVGIRASVAPLMNDCDFTGALADDVGFDLGPALMSEQVRFLPAAELLEMFDDAIAQWHGAADGRIRILAGPGGVQWCSDELLGGLADAAKKAGTGLHVHLLETWLQRRVCEHRYGGSSVSALNELGVLWEGCSLPHSVWIDEDEIGLIAGSGATVVHNPAANLRLGSGRCPVGPLLEAGASVALGTDGSASSDNQNSWEMVKLATLIHNDGDRWVSGADALTMATTSGARVLRPETGAEVIGELKEGAIADVALLDRSDDGLAGVQILEPGLALSESGRSVRHVLVDGNVVVENGRCLTVDEDQLRTALVEETTGRREGVLSPPPSTGEAIERMKLFTQSLQSERQN